jgi:hypothetical protein
MVHAATDAGAEAAAAALQANYRISDSAPVLPAGHFKASLMITA